ncbi:MAG: hypothetical protein HC828_19155 [Blastochloris sp.]|nr:hypothetical protein [Blastochloris sp.]
MHTSVTRICTPTARTSVTALTTRRTRVFKLLVDFINGFEGEIELRAAHW